MKPFKKESAAHVQGVPKKFLTECCCGHGAQAQSPVDTTICVCKLFFWSFLTKINTKPDTKLPSHFDGKIWPHSTLFWLEFFLLATLFWDTLYTSCAREDKDVYQKETKSVLVQILKSKCSPEASYVYSFLISPGQRELL